ncbi:MAG: T9SS type A sorting domain-containing protein [Candidatus Kapabacteria bacterium]|nr:T9SS type A sorting domain-containing protein [Candidatus Kapabacteria bacterium]
MKKRYCYLVLICTLLISIIDLKATQMLLFKAIDSNTNLPLKLDSIQVQDVTNKTHKTITVDSIDLDYYVMGVDDNSNDYNSFVKLNSANPFEYQTSFTIYETNPSNITFSLFDLLGNVVLSKSQYLENGVHNFNLDLGGLNAGIYYLNIQDDLKQNQLKLIKLAKSNGLNSILEFNGSDNSEVVYQKEKTNSVQTNDHIFTFNCFKRGYHVVSYSNYSKTNYEMNLKISNKYDINFPMQKNNNFNYNSMTLVSSKINIIKTKNFSEYGGGTSNSKTTDFESYLQFNEINSNNYPVYNQSYYASKNVSILGCPNQSKDSMRFNLCSFDGYFSNNTSEYVRSYSKITDIRFNKDSNYIDYMNYNNTDVYFKSDYDKKDGTFQGSDSYQMYFTNAYYTFEKNNLVVFLNSDAIKKSVKFASNSSLDWHSVASHFSQSSESIKEISTIPFDAYIKLTLSP